MRRFGCWTSRDSSVVLVALGHREIRMPGELLGCLRGAPRIERCEQDVWRRMWTPFFTFARLAARIIRFCPICRDADQSASSRAGQLDFAARFLGSD
jgi:hypothetical protein